MTAPYVAAEPRENLRLRYQRQLDGLKVDRRSYDDHYREIAAFILPRRARFFLSDKDKAGERMNQNIKDSTGTLAARTLQSGLMAGISSPARPWFQLRTPYPDLNDRNDVKQWLFDVEARIREVFQRSNFYSALSTGYGDLGVFGTATIGIFEDDRKVIRCFPYVIGSYWISNNDRLEVDTFFREFRLTVRQVVGQFVRRPDGTEDWSKVSDFVKRSWAQSQYELPVNICHVIAPNEEMGYGQGGPKGMPFRSVYFEQGGTNIRVSEPYATAVLRDSGFEEFPIMCPRWTVVGEDAYGCSPGMDALPDVKGLQLYEKRSAQLVDKGTNPPLTVPNSLKSPSLLPGDINVVDTPTPAQSVQPTYAPDARWLSAVTEKIREHQERIKRALYEDLFLMLTMDSSTQPITAREVEEKHQEKLLMLGPVLERLNGELLDRAIDRTFNIMQRRGLIAPAPEALQGVPLRVEYISILAQAQKASSLGAIQQMTAFAAGFAQIWPQMARRVDADQVLKDYAEAAGVPPNELHDDDEVAQLEAAAQQQQRALAAAQAAPPLAKAVKDMGSTEMGGDTALTRMLGQSGPSAQQTVQQALGQAA